MSLGAVYTVSFFLHVFVFVPFTDNDDYKRSHCTDVFMVLLYRVAQKSKPLLIIEKSYLIVLKLQQAIDAQVRWSTD